MNVVKSKVILNSKGESYKYNVDVFINREKCELSYVEKDDMKTFVSFNYKNNILKRDNNKMYMEFNFQKQNGYIFVKSLNTRFDIEIVVKNISFTSNSIVIEYYNNKEFYQYKVLGM